MVLQGGWEMSGRNSLLVGVLMGWIAVFVVGCAQPNQPPTVRITEPQEGVLLGSEVAFRAEASDPDGEIRSYRWDFGDGTPSEEAAPTHRYERSGEYRVTLTVTDDRGETAQDGITIRVQVGPKAIATVRQALATEPIVLQYLSGEAPLTVAFDGTRSRPEPGTQIVSYEWDFGDGTSGEGPTPVHTYTDAGEYEAVLTVTDDRGRADTTTVTVKVVSYEATQETLELDGLSVQVALYDKQEAPFASGLSLVFRYVVEAPRRLTEGEIRQLLETLIERAKQRPRLTRITLYLFDRVRKNFMIPRDYAHYLGNAVWDGTLPEEERLALSISLAYLQRAGLEVLGYEIRETLLLPDDPVCGPACGEFRLGFAEMYLQDEPICEELLQNTLQEIASWRLLSSYEGFVANVYSRDVRRPLAWMLGRRAQLQDELAWEDFPQGLLVPWADEPTQPEWHIRDETVRIAWDPAQVPPCPAQSP